MRAIGTEPDECLDAAFEEILTLRPPAAFADLWHAYFKAWFLSADLTKEVEHILFARRGGLFL